MICDLRLTIDEAVRVSTRQSYIVNRKGMEVCR